MTSRASLRTVLRAPLAIALLAGATSILPLTGCKDGTIESQVAVQRELDQIASDYRSAAMVRSPLTLDESIKRIESLATKASGLSGGSPEQQGAAAVLTASIAQTAAELHLENARALARQLASDRGLAAATANAAAALQSLADATANVSLGQDREFLAESRDAAQTALRQAQEALKQVEGPMGELRTGIAGQREQLAALQAQADDLRRRAIEAGASAGFPLVEEAADVKADARTVRTAVALNELKLAELEPEAAIVNDQLVTAQGLKSASDAALGELDNFATELSNDAQTTSKAADEFRKATEALLAQIAERTTALNTSFDTIEAALTKAESSAGRAGSGSRELATTARNAKLSAQAALGALLAERAAQLTAQIDLHTTLGNAGQLFGGSAKQGEAIAALTTAREEIVTRAKEKLVEAVGSTGEPSESDRPATVATRNALNGMIAVLEGKAAAPASPTPAGAAAPAGAGAAAVAPTGPGFPSPDEMVAAMTSKNPEDSYRLVGAFHATNPEARALVGFLRSTVEDMRPLIDAASAKFGPEALSSLSSGPSTQFVTASIASSTDTTAVVSGTTFAGTTESVTLVKIGDGWYVDADALVAEMSPEERAAMQAASSMQAQMPGMRGAMKAAASAVAAKITSGEITSPAEIQTALTQELMQQMAPGGAR
jgi:hypothetical protein